MGRSSWIGPSMKKIFAVLVRLYPQAELDLEILHEKVKKALRIVSLFATIIARQIGGHGPIAQLVEQWIEDPRVDGSNPSRATPS